MILPPNLPLPLSRPPARPPALTAFVGSRAYAADPFSCPTFDVTTGFAVTRSITVFIGCNQAGKETDPLSVIGYVEESPCQYNINTSHKLACGAAGDPYDIIYLSPSAAPSPAATPLPSGVPPPTAAGAQTTTTGEKAGFSALGIVIALPISFAAFIILDSYNLLNAMKPKSRRFGAESVPLAPTQAVAYGDTPKPAPYERQSTGFIGSA